MDKRKIYYQALIERDASYEGLFYVGVKTTGVFCRPTCPARKPKLENCVFFSTAKEALQASFRPCQRCKPLHFPNQASPLIEKLIEAIESNPEKRWKDRDFKELCVDASTARRQFKKRFGMTFVEYARTRRMGIAFAQIREGESLIETQLDMGYESSSGFRDAFSRIMGASPTKTSQRLILKSSILDTKLGPMIAVADEEHLYLIEFTDRRGLEKEIERLRKRHKAAIVPGSTPAIQMIRNELDLYFEGNLKNFKTPLCLLGSPFHKRVWNELVRVPYGETISYADLAVRMGNPNAFRAVANANGANQFAIVIPCHRVIHKTGELGGYGGGKARKEWLIKFEADNK